MSEAVHCWKCGKPLEGLILPLSRREECAHCRVEIHVCRMCNHYDPMVSDQCREDRAEPVTEKDRANFCDYLSLNANAHQARDNDAQAKAQAELAALFGDEAPPTESDSNAAVPMDETEKAKAALDALFDFGNDKN